MMKRISVLLTVCLLFSALSCNKPAPATQPGQEGTASGETGTENSAEEVKKIPSLVKFERGAGLYKQIGDKKVEFSGSRAEQFDEIQYLGEEKKMTYIESNKEQEGVFSRCLVQVGDELVEYWIYTENLAYNTKVGVVVTDCLLYSKDKLDKISDKELKLTDLVIVDNDYFNKDFFKIIAPAISTKTVYYIRKDDLSVTPVDIALARLYKTAMGLGEGKEKAKGQILQSAYNEYSQSSLIYLVESELVSMGILSPEGSMGEEDGYYDEDAGIGEEEGSGAE